MVSGRWFSGLIRPYKPKKPFFRRLDLSKQRSFNDTENKQYVSDPVFRTSRTNAITGAPSRNHLDTYPVLHNAQAFIFVGPAPEAFAIQPPLEEVWLLDRITVWQADNQARDFNLSVIGIGPPGPAALLVPIYPVGHTPIENGGAGNEQTLFPVYHSLGGVEQDHLGTVSGPLQLDNDHYVQITAAALNVDAQYNYKWLYRRIQ